MSARESGRTPRSAGGLRAVRGAAAHSKMAAGSLIARSASKRIFVGPSVEGGDEEYVKVASGQVNVAKPSFA